MEIYADHVTTLNEVLYRELVESIVDFALNRVKQLGDQAINQAPEVIFIGILLT